MNTEQIRDALIRIAPPPKPFTVVLSGKGSRKVNGLYKPDSAEIVIHNKNFRSDNALMYTAVHEYAHHLMFVRGQVKGARAHTVQFWAINHSLIATAKEKGVVTDPFEDDQELKAKAAEIREIQQKQLELQKELGRKLLEMRGLCDEKEARYDDYIDRVARIPKKAAAAAISAQMELPAIANMVPHDAELLSSLKGDARTEAIGRIMKGESTEQIVAAIRQRKTIDPNEDEPEPAKTEGDRERLVKERKRIFRTISHLKARMAEIDRTLADDQPDMFEEQKSTEAADST